MAIKTEIVITHEDASVDAADFLLTTDTSNKVLQINKLLNFFKSLRLGMRKATVKVQVGSVQASGTATASTAVATNTVVVNGYTFTAVASGATAAQFNLGADDTAAMASLAAQINASTDAKILNIVTATSAAAVCTITAVDAGLTGNAITLTASGAITASAARLASGTDGTEKSFVFGGA